MPHIPEVEKVAIMERTLFPNQVGQPCWLFAQWMLGKYNELPKWSTIHELRKQSKYPYQHEETLKIISDYCSSFHKTDIETAADLAFMEFYRVVGAAHEDVKRMTNGCAFQGARIPNE